MLRNTAANASRFSRPKKSRISKGVTVPVVNVRPRPPVSIAAKPILEPAIVSLTPCLKTGRWDPRPGDSVALLEPTVFKHPIRRDILHLCVTHYLDSLRQGSASTKTRGEVRGSGIKIRRQKGSGKARLGDGQSPMLRGGGIAFGPKPRDFSTKLPRKVIEMGMRIALSSKLKEQRLGVMTRLYWPCAKTKPLSLKIDQLGLRKTLFVTGSPTVHEGLRRAMQNIPLVNVTTADQVNVYEVLKWDRIILDLKGVEYFEKLLKKKNVPTVPVHLLPRETPSATSKQISEEPPSV